MNAINSITNFEIFSIGKFSLTIGMVFTVVLLIVITRLLLWVIEKIIFRNRKFRKYEEGSLHSLFQIIKYIVWIFTILIVLETIGLKLDILLAGSAALLVGIGLGLQNTFNDFISGLILLFEGSIRVGDILQVDDEVVKIKRIGMRTSEAINRNDIVTILPNSLITTNKVINWSHQSKKTRFKIDVGVSYGSDVKLVMDILKQSALEHPEITDKESIAVLFLDFGTSSLDFRLLFFSHNIFRIEKVKSEIRIIINRKFIENNITIPFPQMDLHLKSNNTDTITK